MMLLLSAMRLLTEGMRLSAHFAERRNLTGILISTSGGSGGTTTTVTTLSALTSAVSGDSKKIVIISGKTRVSLQEMQAL